MVVLDLVVQCCVGILLFTVLGCVTLCPIGTLALYCITLCCAVLCLDTVAQVLVCSVLCRLEA